MRVLLICLPLILVGACSSTNTKKMGSINERTEILAPTGSHRGLASEEAPQEEGREKPSKKKSCGH